jgi:Na+-driven multidrug efflux pump
MGTNTADRPDGAADGSARLTNDRKWPWAARLLVTIALLPVWAAAILASENSFNFIGNWFGPLMTAVMVAVVIAVWVATARWQR